MGINILVDVHFRSKVNLGIDMFFVAILKRKRDKIDFIQLGIIKSEKNLEVLFSTNQKINVEDDNQITLV